MPTKLAAWLAQTVEEALEPEIPICGPHHHAAKTYRLPAPPAA